MGLVDVCRWAEAILNPNLFFGDEFIHLGKIVLTRETLTPITK